MKGIVMIGLTVALLGCTSRTDQTGEPALEETYWKLVELEGKPPLANAGAREAHLRLSPGEKRAAGSAGCNSMGGSYELAGSSLRFSRLMSTKMMCQEELMLQETAFAKALEATAAWKVTGGGLALMNADGAVLARFEPKPAP